MSENNKNNATTMEDISSVSKEHSSNSNIVTAYTTGLYKNLGNIIKAIAFIIAFLIIIVGFFVAFFLFAKTSFSIILSLAAVVASTVFAAIIFFLIFEISPDK